MKKRKIQESKAKCAAIGAAIIIGLYLLSAIIMTAAIAGNEKGTELTGIFSLATLMISGGLGTFISAKLFRFPSFLSSLSPASAVLVLYTVLALIFTGGKVGLSHAMNMLCFILICVLFAFLSMPKPKARHSARR